MRQQNHQVRVEWDVTQDVLGKVSKKTFFFGTLSQTWDPTHPPRTFGTPLSEKQKLSLFCFLGYLEHLEFLEKM